MYIVIYMYVFEKSSFFGVPVFINPNSVHIAWKYPIFLSTLSKDIYFFFYIRLKDF